MNNDQKISNPDLNQNNDKCPEGQVHPEVKKPSRETIEAAKKAKANIINNNQTVRK